jgi:papain like protease
MTDIAQLTQLGPRLRTLRALGIDTIEHFVAATQVAGPELARLLGGNLDTLVAPAMAMAQAMSADVESELVALPCSLGARTDDITPITETVPALALDIAVGACGPPLITPAIPIRNQQFRGTCVAHAVVAALEYWLNSSGSYQDMSEQFLYWNCKNNDGAPTQPGTWIRVAAPLVQRDGVCPEAVWPYNPNPIPGNEAQNPVPMGAQRQALPYRVPVVTALPATSISDYKTALASQRWVPFSIPVYNSWYQSSQVRLTGDITNPIPGETRVGGHAMCIVGCIDQPDRPELGGGRFILRNSWGTGWGQTSPYGSGYGTIPYIYIQRFGMEAYTLG